ncbi:MAG: hypothetical protein RLZZ303_99 [Candidatus Hydrogenedentota bacterium]|jgi:hypothetical protein
MRRNQIIFGSVLVLVLAAFGGVYQFYFKEKLAQYNRDKQFRKDLETSAEELSTFFSGVKPDTVISRWRNQVQPWADALNDRAEFFNDGQWFDHEEPPAQGRILRLWYGEEQTRMLDELYKSIYEKAPGLYAFPEDILRSLEIKTENELAQEREITPQILKRELAKLSFADSLINLLLDEKILALRDIKLWPRRQDNNHKKQLVLLTVGFEVDMYMRHLVHFLEVLRRQRRYFHIDAIHVSNRRIAEQFDPPLNVRVIMTQARFSGTGADGGQAGGAGSARSMFEITTPRTAPPPPPPAAEPTMLQKAWKLFKRYVLFTNK